MSLERLGLVKSTLVDFPGTVAATVFTFGCPLRCSYCHNPELAEGEIPSSFVSRDEVMAFLTKRRGVLGGVCITGGEPLMHREIANLIKEIKAMGYKVKLDTSGLYPQRLGEVGPLCDYIALDLKTQPMAYGRLTKNRKDEGNCLADKVRASLMLLRTLGVKYEIRTTVAAGIIGKDDIAPMVQLLVPKDVYWIQKLNIQHLRADLREELVDKEGLGAALQKGAESREVRVAVR